MMITINDLGDIFALFSEGIAIGIILGGVPFIVGYAVQGVINIMANRKS